MVNVTGYRRRRVHRQQLRRGLRPARVPRLPRHGPRQAHVRRELLDNLVEARAGDPGAPTVRARRHLRRRRRAPRAMEGCGVGRQLRRRDARGPGPVGCRNPFIQTDVFGAFVLLQAALPSSAVSSVRADLHRRGVRVRRRDRGLHRGDDNPQPEQPLRGEQGGRRPARLFVFRDAPGCPSS